MIISPHPVEDLWERGHSNDALMVVRDKYLRFVNLLKFRPDEKEYVFEPTRDDMMEDDWSQLHWGEFSDWDGYRSSPDMVREGISLLNQYYYEKMKIKPLQANNNNKVNKSERDLQIIQRVIECLGGVLGFRVTMEPCIPPDMREMFSRRVKEYVDKDFREFADDLRMKNRGWEHDYDQWVREHPYRDPRSPRGTYWDQHPLSAKDLERVINENKPPEVQTWHIPSTLMAEQIETVKNNAIAMGFTIAEVQNLIQWQKRTVSHLEEKALNDLVRIVANINSDHATYEREQGQIYRTYAATMSVFPLVAKFGVKHYELPYQETEPYTKKVIERVAWQMKRLQYFIVHVFDYIPAALEDKPIQILSTTFDETPKREKTQSEIIDETAQELSNLPRFSAYAKMIDESQGEQVVLKGKIKTLPLPPLNNQPRRDGKVKPNIEPRVLENGHKLCKRRDEIEKEILQRQARWRARRTASGSPPPSEEPPPAHS